MRRPALLLLVAAGCGGASETGLGPVDRGCNGTEANCARTFDQVSSVCTHNAMSSEQDGFTLPTPNQAQGFTRQLDDGVRCMMLDTYKVEDQLLLCHGICGPWGQRDLVDGLGEIGAWLKAHPREVLSFILEANITEEETLAALTTAGLEPMLYHHAGPPGTPWPTLGEMVESNQRLVVLTDDGDAAADWHLDWRAHGWETPFDDASFTCDHGRGDPTRYPNQLFILNHYTLCQAGGCPENAVDNNAFDFLQARSERCAQVDAERNPSGQQPTFINLDHYDLPVAGGPDASAPDGIEVAAWWNAQ